MLFSRRMARALLGYPHAMTWSPSLRALGITTRTTTALAALVVGSAVTACSLPEVRGRSTETNAPGEEGDGPAEEEEGPTGGTTSGSTPGRRPGGGSTGRQPPPTSPEGEATGGGSTGGGGTTGGTTGGSTTGGATGGSATGGTTGGGSTGGTTGGGTTGGTTGGGTTGGTTGTPNPNAPSFARDVKPILESYCLECHSGGVAPILVALPFSPGDTAQVTARILATMTTTMPPAPRDKAPATAVQMITRWRDGGYAP
jgi:hypothetical protein